MDRFRLIRSGPSHDKGHVRAWRRWEARSVRGAEAVSSSLTALTIPPAWWNGIHLRFKIGGREAWGFESPRRHHARVTEAVYVPGSNPGAARYVSSNLTARTRYRTGVTAAHLTLTYGGRGSNPRSGAMCGSHTTAVCRSPKPVIVVQIHGPVPKAPAAHAEQTGFPDKRVRS